MNFFGSYQSRDEEKNVGSQAKEEMVLVMNSGRRKAQ